MNESENIGKLKCPGCGITHIMSLESAEKVLSRRVECPYCKGVKLVLVSKRVNGETINAHY